MFEPNSHVVDYVDDFLHDALAPRDAAYVEHHCEDCRGCGVALGEARKRREALESLPACEASEDLVRAALAQVDAHETKRRRRFTALARATFVSAAACVLLLTCAHLYYHNLSASPYDLQVFGQTRLLAGTEGSLRVRLVDRGNGRALAGVPVVLDLRDKRGGQSVELARFTTDARGTGRPRFRLPDSPDGSYELCVTARPAGEAETLTQPVQLKRSWKLMLSSDKPVYQPGQTLHLRALALRRPDLKPVAEREAMFAVTDPKGNVVFKRRVQTSPYGITAADCPLADEVIEGPYTVACKVGDTESKIAVEVMKYVLPKFKIDAQLDRPYYAPREQVRGTVSSDYFFGKPVADALVEVEVRTTDVAARVERRLSTRTDAAGKAAFDFVLPGKLVGREQDGGDARFAVHVAVTDSAGQKQTKALTRLVTARPLRVEAIPEAGSLVPGVTNRVYLFASYADGRPARVDLTVTGLEGAAAERLRTSAMGVAAVETTFNAKALDLTVEAVATADAASPPLSCRRQVRLTSRHGATDFLVRTDKAVYTAGDTMHLVAFGGGQEPVFVDFIKDGQTVLTQTVDLAGGCGEYALDLPPELFGTVELCAYRFGQVGLPVRKTRVVYVRQARQLDIQATLDRAEYRPSHRAQLQLRVTDEEGKPTPGALSLAAVDEAVFAVLDQAPGMERAFYTLEQQLLQPVYAVYPWSPDLTTSLPPAEQDQFEQALFARTARAVDGPLQAPPAGRNSPAASPHTLTGSSFPVKTRQVEATRTAALQKITRLWLALGIVAVAAGYLLLWFFIPVSWMVGLHVIGLLVVVAVTSLGTNANKTFTTVSSSVAGGGAPSSAPLHGSLAPTPSDDTARTDGTASESPGTPPGVRVRDWFPETLLWRPEVITDDHGRAAIDVDLADSITTWRLTASAVAPDGRLGAVQAPVRVFQPFFADLNLPVALTRGDEVTLPVVVYNYLDRPQTVELTLGEAAWFERLDDAVKRLDLAAGEVRSAAYRIRAAKVGSHQLEVTARAAGVADALKKPIEVAPDGRRVERVVNGTLQRPTEIDLTVPDGVIEGSARAVLKLYPSGFSQLVEGLDGILRMPSGCFEQTSSTTYPNVLALAYLRRTQKSVPEVEAKARQYIHLGYQRLLGFEVQGGGFDWFGRPLANRTLTAYGLMEFEDMARVHDVDPNLIARTRKWLLGQRQADGSWAAERGMLNDGLAGNVHGSDRGDLSTTAYIAWAVFNNEANREEAGRTRDFLLSHPPQTIDDPHALALVCNALLAIEPNGRDVWPYLERLEGLRRTTADQKHTWWEQAAGARTTFHGSGRSGTVETTALAALALVASGKHSGTARGALAWLVTQKDASGTWYSTQATVLALKALLAGTGTPLGGERERRITVTWGEGEGREVVIPVDQADVMQQIDLSGRLTPGTHRLTLAEKGDDATGYQLAFRYHVPGERQDQAGPLSIDLAYDRTELALGDTVTATASVVNRTAQAAPMVILDLPTPAGFALLAEDFAELVRSQAIAKYQVSPRGVTVYLRGLEPKKPLSLRYRLRAVMPVQVTAPPARAYEYYDPGKQGRTPPVRLSVRVDAM